MFVYGTHTFAIFSFTHYVSGRGQVHICTWRPLPDFHCIYACSYTVVLSIGTIPSLQCCTLAIQCTTLQSWELCNTAMLRVGSCPMWWLSDNLFFFWLIVSVYCREKINSFIVNQLKYYKSEYWPCYDSPVNITTNVWIVITAFIQLFWWWNAMI